MRSICKAGIWILICYLFSSCSKSGMNPNTGNNQGSKTTDTTKSITQVTTPPITTIINNKTYTVSNPLILNGAHDMVINGLEIKNPTGICIFLVNCYNITIKNCNLGPSLQTGVELHNCTNIKVDSCVMSNISTGMYALDSSGIQFTNNDVENVQGPFPKGAMVQFDDVSGTGNRVLNNRCENISGQSNPEDVISMYKSNGTKADPIQITGNLIRGGGPSRTGGGIMLGDNGGSYIIAENNILVNPGNYGMAIAGGNNLQIINNMIYSSQTTVSNVGIYIWNQSSGGCSLNTISNNQVNWTMFNGQSNNSWDNGNCGTVLGWNTNLWGANLSPDILPAQLF
jgi:parallel beta-helix repeat protein